MSNLCCLFYMINNVDIIFSCRAGEKKNNQILTIFFFPLFCAGWDSDQSGRFIVFWRDLYSVVQPVASQANSRQKNEGPKWRIHVSVKQAVTRLTGLGEQCAACYCNSRKKAIDSNCAVALWLLQYVNCPPLKVWGPVVLQALSHKVTLCVSGSYMGFQTC